jgi:hypothetical protein
MRKGMGMDHLEQDPLVDGQPLAEDLVAVFVQQGVSSRLQPERARIEFDGDLDALDLVDLPAVEFSGTHHANRGVVHGRRPDAESFVLVR